MTYLMNHVCSSVIILDMGLYINWNDKRLKYSNCTGIVNPSVMKDIWLPKPYLHHLISRDNPDQVIDTSSYLEATSSEGFYWWLEIIFGIQCSFDFTYYPFDEQVCSVKFQSTSFPIEVVQYSTWYLLKSVYGIEHDLKYRVEFVQMKEDQDLVLYDGSYNWSTCGFNIKLDRKLTPAVLNFFVPSVLIVIITFCRLRTMVPHTQL